MSAPKDKYVVDRYEGGLAVLISDSGEAFTVPGLSFPEGSVLEADGNGGYVRCMDEEEERRRRLQDKMDSLFRRKA